MVQPPEMQNLIRELESHFEPARQLLSCMLMMGVGRNRNHVLCSAALLEVFVTLGLYALPVGPEDAVPVASHAPSCLHEAGTGRRLTDCDVEVGALLLTAKQRFGTSEGILVLAVDFATWSSACERFGFVQLVPAAGDSWTRTSTLTGRKIGFLQMLFKVEWRVSICRFSGRALGSRSPGGFRYGDYLLACGTQGACCFDADAAVRTGGIGSLNRQERSRERAIFEVRDSCTRTSSRVPSLTLPSRVLLCTHLLVTTELAWRCHARRHGAGDARDHSSLGPAADRHGVWSLHLSGIPTRRCRPASCDC